MSRCADVTRQQRGRLARDTALGLFTALALAACGGGGEEATTEHALGRSMGAAAAAEAAALTPKESLGKLIFFDASLSLDNNQSCATCHGPEAGWTGPDATVNANGSVYEGSVPGRFGNRKPPSSAYATQSPILHFTMAAGDALFVGGSFWDGRATGERLGSPAADQALGPFLNPLEQALPSASAVVAKICAGSYAVLFTQVWGMNACDPANAAAAYDQVGLSIAAYEASPESNAFSSKFDLSRMGKAQLTPQEHQGFALFMGKGKCARCHTATPGQAGGALFTDYTFDNLGLPRNPDNPFYDADVIFNPLGLAWVDAGLGGFLGSRADYQALAADNLGKHKVPTLRNVDKRPFAGFVKAYGHNGYFKSLKTIVHFYNTRDVKPRCPDAFTREADALAQGCWPEPEVDANVNTSELGNLGLTPAQEDAIVAFLMTLSDGYTP